MLFRPFGAPELTQEPTQSSPAVSKDRLVKSVVRRQRVFMTEAPNDLSLEELARRKAWFNEYTARLDGGPPALPLRCPSCGCKTLCERGGFQICQVCFWEDDGQDDYDADIVRGGPNGRLNLTQARANYRAFGACDERFVGKVRPPRSDELPE
jgi:hypothetical protein